MSVLSSNCILNGKRVASNSKITYSKILNDISEILEGIVSFDKSIASIFFHCSKSQTNSTVSIAHDLIIDLLIMFFFSKNTNNFNIMSIHYGL